MCVYSDNAQMMSKCSKNKKVCNSPLASASMTDVLMTIWHQLCIIRVHEHGQMESIYYIHLSIYKYKIQMNMIDHYMLFYIQYN